ncbi:MULTISPECIES: efflux RND transporter permease subunit [Flavobacteriaceae]|uniref:RND family transporter n=2 Tax=Flavobacteriaceae TaxID=49546 RepID=A0A4Y8ASR0_9FLAO|nr:MULTISPECIES: efflux RND transporter permease subunit [Flavobacteriaceae]TEW74915.1 RND family transporter [Gramella jeungdoensis]GGK43097.1 transporter [Lutibacter litoralis]
MNFWTHTSRLILKGRYFIILLIAACTYFLASQMQYMRFSYTEANLLPENHQINIDYNKFLELFGEEGNLIILATEDPSIFTPEKFNAWNSLSKKLDSFAEVDFTVAIGDIQKLTKNKDEQKFDLEPLYEKDPETTADVLKIKNELFENLPFYDNFLYNKKSETIRTIVYLKKDIVNTSIRKDFIFDALNPTIEKFEKDYNIDIRVSGMPYIRTMNAQNIIDEIGIFVALALGVTALIFFFFFRSFRATFITLIVVSIGVVWAFGFIGLFRYEITVLMALIPPLIIVIGVPNAIFLINKYQQEVKKHGNQAKSLQRVISKIGNATLMTNVTTASGFATFIFTKSQLLREFGTIASINILAIFVLALLIIPIMYSFLPLPKEKHLKHLERRWIDAIVTWMESIVRNHRLAVYASTIVLIIVSMIGVYMIKISGSLIEDMPKGKQFFKDIVFFEEEFGGIMPLEIIIDTKAEKGVMKLSTLQRMNKLDETIDEIPQLSKSISVLNIVKYSKQAFYSGKPEYYQLPNNQEKNWILAYTKNATSNTDLLNNFVDSTGRYARITTFMKDIGTEKMAGIEERIQQKIDKEFPKEDFDVSMTGGALVFLKGTTFLINNLVISLSLAILLIAVFMAFLFRSFRMIVISLIPNIFPLLITAGLMGYLGVPIKPSTILVFSIAFGISVDDTIHFLAKYRQELIANNWRIKQSVYAALRETGVSMFYTSIVLFFGFLVFTVSSFGGTIALGGLVSITLLFAMVSNLLLLPSLLLSLEKKIANKKTFKEPTLDILTPEDTNGDT